MLRNVLSASTVAGNSCVATVSHPKVHVVPTILQRFEHHDLVVADQRNKPAVRHQVDQRFNDLVRLHATIDVVAQADDRVFKGRANFSQQRM